MRVIVDPEIFLTYRAKDIQTALSDSPTCVDVQEDPVKALQRLDDFSYDQAPVTSDGVIVGWLLTGDLKKSLDVNLAYNRLSQKDLISSHSPLNEALQRLTKQELIFLVGAEGIEGFVVRSDIERHVSRAHFYLLISGLEIVMSRIVNRDVTNSQQLIDLMKPSSKIAWENAKFRNIDANPIEYLDLRALGSAISLIQPSLNHLGLKKEIWLNYITLLTNLRNWVAHSNTDELNRASFFDIVDLMNKTESYIRKLIAY